MLKKVLSNYPLSLLIISATWILCFIPIPHTPLSEVRMMDKWTHVAMFAAISASLLFESHKAFRKATRKQLAVVAFAMPLLMGGLIELLQAYCTGGLRSGDWLDFAADAIGSCVGMLIGTLLAAFRAKARTED